MIRFIPRYQLLLLVPLAVAAGGCSYMQRQAFAQPEVEVSDVRLSGVGLQGGKIDILMNVYNPNNYRLDASSVRYKVHVDSIQLAEGVIEQRVTLNKRGTSAVKIPVTFAFRDVLAVGAQLTRRGTLPFELTGDMKVETPFGSVTRAFYQRGDYDGVNVSILPGRRKP